ncbi:MAG: hypothetical protein FJW14_03225 [Acidimicrobiia bacterium]|nr:hypothetical protein [Acidimicrobiia bacterium]
MRAFILVLVVLIVPSSAFAQARTAAPVDLTGYWVSMITDFWRYRMLTPPKGNVDYLPITPEGRKVTDAWDPARDEAAGEQCRGYGAVGVMRMPGRLHITWESDDVLKLDADAGTQTRRFHFAAAPATGGGTWQGTSTARWARPFTPQSPDLAPQGELRVTTTRMRPGYLRKNGVPYSANASMTEYFVRLVDDDGQQYLAVTQALEDSQYFVTPIVRTMLFKKQADGTGWNPTPCSAR